MKRYIPIYVVAGVLLAILWLVSRKSSATKSQAAQDLDNVLSN